MSNSFLSYLEQILSSCHPVILSRLLPLSPYSPLSASAPILQDSSFPVGSNKQSQMTQDICYSLSPAVLFPWLSSLKSLCKYYLLDKNLMITFSNEVLSITALYSTYVFNQHVSSRKKLIAPDINFLFSPTYPNEFLVPRSVSGIQVKYPANDKRVRVLLVSKFSHFALCVQNFGKLKNL